MAKRVLKWTVSVDDAEHPVGPGPVGLVGCQGDPHKVQVWTEEQDPEGGQERALARAIVVGTGQPAPDGWELIGSVALRPMGRDLVWHVYRSPAS